MHNSVFDTKQLDFSLIIQEAFFLFGDRNIHLM